MFGRTKVSKPKSDAEIITEAVKEAQRQYERRERGRRRRERFGRFFGWFREAPSWLKTLLTVGLILLVALIADGIRRESAEFKANLVAFSGQVWVQKSDSRNWIAPEPNMALRDKDLVRTGANGTATLVFPDGSAVQLEPNTEFEVRLLDFFRGGTRDRSFMVRMGSVIAYVSQFFGAKSQGTVCTPTAVAAVRGTGFRVVYEPSTQQTYLQVVDGSVQFKTPVGEIMAQAGQLGSASGYQIQTTQSLPADAQRLLAANVNTLRQHEKPPSFLQRIEWAILNPLDPFLQILGLTPGGWSYAAADFARRTMALEAMRRLRTHMEALNEVPNYLNPVTLAELNLHPAEKERILRAFAGNMLESYRKVGRDQYIIRARARDKRRTLFEADIAGVRQVQE
ncbi:MAG: FecR domain-containing protein [Armatimonadetes bacterium]|nr:FecR domain-containing protein [Armatimonadota bacterium]MDW8026911.1 FecR family protein [Armatimonadota bacterium]